MKYYLDITLLPDAEANIGFIWQKVYQQIHIALVENKTAQNQSAIAVSFPQYGEEFPLGNTLRLLANEKGQLEQLNVEKWLSRLTDYTHLKSIKEVPVTVTQFARFKRKQFKSNLDREAKRRAKYKGEPFEEALAHFQSYQTETSLPFINMTSLSTDGRASLNRNFKLFIQKEMVGEQEQGLFNCYGLSKGGEGAVPWFLS